VAQAGFDGRWEIALTNRGTAVADFDDLVVEALEQ
jgi:hypothetical protein